MNLQGELAKRYARGDLSPRSFMQRNKEIDQVAASKHKGHRDF